MIMHNLKHKEHITISNKININNNYKDGRLLPFIYSKSFIHIYLKNVLKRTVNGLLLGLSKKNEQ